MREEFEKIVTRLRGGRRLSRGQSRAAILYVCSGTAGEDQIRDLLTHLTWQNATVEEIAGAAGAMREMVLPLPISNPAILDTCGTGGDARHTFNISTAAALISAACGVKIVKHGNRSASGKAGSADVLEKLGVNLQPPPERLAQCLESANICFAFARAFHPAMRHVAAVRRAMGTATIFNVLGPLANPARAKLHLLGVFSADLTEPMAAALRELGSQRAWVVHAEDGLDEISTLGPTRISELKDGKIQTWTLDPADLGMRRATLAELQITDLDDAAKVLMDVLKGQAGPKRDIALLNAAAALVIAGKAEDIQTALPTARQALDAGRAQRTVENLIRLTQQVVN